MTWVRRSSSEPRRLLRVHGLWVLAVTAAVLAGAWAFAAAQAPTYVSTAEVVVETEVTPNTTPLPPNMATERQLVISGVVLSRAAEQAHMDEGLMQRSSSVTVPADTSFLDISCTAKDPGPAQNCAAALSQSYVAYRAAATADGKSSAPGAGASKSQSAQAPVDAVLVSTASFPAQASGTSRILLLGIGFCLGLALGVGTAFVRDRFDDRIRGRVDAEQHLGAPIPAGVPRSKGIPASQVVMQAPESAAAAVYRYLRVRLEAALLAAPPEDGTVSDAPARGHVVLVVGGRSGDGSSTIASNLALSFALAGRRTVLVDADITRVGVEALYGLGERAGLVDVLVGSAAVPDVLQQSPLEGLKLLTAGSRAQRRRDLVRADRLRSVLDRVRDEADMVVIDGTALSAASDPLVLAMVSDLVLVVLDAKRTTRTLIDGVAGELASVGVDKIMGVLNRIRAGDLPRVRGLSALIPQSAEALPETWQQAAALPTEHPGVLVARHAGNQARFGIGISTEASAQPPMQVSTQPPTQADVAAQAPQDGDVPVPSGLDVRALNDAQPVIDLGEHDRHRLINLPGQDREWMHSNGADRGTPGAWVRGD